MKKAIGLILAVTLAFSLCGCMPSLMDIRGNYHGKPVSVPTPAPEVLEEDFSMGTVAGTVYENPFIGLGFTLDDGWTFYDDAQIRELNNVAKDLAGEDYKELVESANIVYDMCAVDGDALNNVNVNLEKVSNALLIGLDIAKNYEEILPTISESLTNMGYQNVKTEIKNVVVAGKTLPAMYTTAEINGVAMYQTAFSKKCNGYLASVTATAFFQDTTDDIFNHFYWL